MSCHCPVDSEDGSPSKRPKHDFFPILNNNAGPQESELEKFLNEPVGETNTILKYPIIKKNFSDTIARFRLWPLLNGFLAKRV